jgi:hypothetical protein
MEWFLLVAVQEQTAQEQGAQLEALQHQTKVQPQLSLIRAPLCQLVLVQLRMLAMQELHLRVMVLLEFAVAALLGLLTL